MITFYCRLAKAAVLAKFKSKLTLGETSEIHFRATLQECEDLRIMNASRVINLAELGNHYNNLRNGFFQAGLKHNLWPLTRRYQVDFIKPVRVFRKVIVRTRVCYWT